MATDPSKQYEKLLEKLIKAYSRRIQQVYFDAINEISLFAALYSSRQVQLSQSIFDAFPAIKNKFDEIMQKMHDGIFVNVAKSISEAWELSNHKNDKIADSLVADFPLTRKVQDLVYNPNADALQTFLKRKIKGLNLSDRVWNLVEPYKYELETALVDGIGKGRSAAEMATDLKRYLKEPDKLFRRVKNKETGRLNLSREARNYHPGQGVARSSYKNALRLAGTETNLSYRRSDSERWKKQPFTKGIEVKLSNNHPEFDVCDALKGMYPKDFVFLGNHPNCRCYAVPVLVSDEEFDKQEDYLLGLADRPPKIEQIKEIPEEAKNWIKENAKRINGWKQRPYWAKENPKYVNKLLKAKK